MKSPIKPPTEGISYLLDENYLSNQRKNGEWPELVELYIFVERWRNKKHEQRFVHTISAPTEEQALAELREFALRADVTLVEETTRKVIPKLLEASDE